jgi:hypothetical protein
MLDLADHGLHRHHKYRHAMTIATLVIVLCATSFRLCYPLEIYFQPVTAEACERLADTYRAEPQYRDPAWRITCQSNLVYVPQ